MNNETRQDLEASIVIWQDRLDNCELVGQLHMGWDSCPLCTTFNREGRGSCHGCPVRERTGRPGCQGTPHQALAKMRMTHLSENPSQSRDPRKDPIPQEMRELIREEVEFLTSLHPSSEGAGCGEEPDWGVVGAAEIHVGWVALAVLGLLGLVFLAGGWLL